MKLTSLRKESGWKFKIQVRTDPGVLSVRTMYHPVHVNHFSNQRHSTGIPVCGSLHQTDWTHRLIILSTSS